MAALRRAPCSTRWRTTGLHRPCRRMAMAGSIPGRFEGFGVPALAIASSDVDEISLAASKAMAEVGRWEPQALVIDTNRFAPNSKATTRGPRRRSSAAGHFRPDRDPRFPARSESA